ncbi:MAG TPA: LuxR C-terminal-related transcriptional regulator [Polyangiaceae bacterium]|nr:LuxR C-terminal-related transcriptional regulator [Polyangiaceae bacterium]
MANTVLEPPGDIETGEGAPRAERLWREVVAGRLQVLRHQDQNGRRYLYVQAASPKAGKERDLTERERLVVGYRAYGQGLKRIAFELGVSVPTVTRCLARALGKLGLKNDMQLPALFGVGLRERQRG